MSDADTIILYQNLQRFRYKSINMYSRCCSSLQLLYWQNNMHEIYFFTNSREFETVSNICVNSGKFETISNIFIHVHKCTYNYKHKL